MSGLGSYQPGAGDATIGPGSASASNPRDRFNASHIITFYTNRVWGE
jgi:hypothetical protein